MIAGMIFGLALGWLVAGGIVMRIAFKSELAGEPLSASDIPVVIGGVLLWPYLLYPDQGDAEDDNA